MKATFFAIGVLFLATSSALASDDGGYFYMAGRVGQSRLYTASSSSTDPLASLFGGHVVRRDWRDDKPLQGSIATGWSPSRTGFRFEMEASAWDHADISETWSVTTTFGPPAGSPRLFDANIRLSTITASLLYDLEVRRGTSFFAGLGVGLARISGSARMNAGAPVNINQTNGAKLIVAGLAQDIGDDFVIEFRWRRLDAGTFDAGFGGCVFGGGCSQTWIPELVTNDFSLGTRYRF
jgi:opacity protein-like surface antigen